MSDKLAINGGKKTINISRPHYVWPEITTKTRSAVLKQLNESISIYNRGGIIAKLEDRFLNYYNKKHALLTNSGTTALYSMFVGAGLKEGDEIICPAYTFYATVTPLFFIGAIPILADCKEDGDIDPAEIAKKITPKTKGIIVTHMWGLPCDMTLIVKLAKKHKLMLFEDASHAHFATYKNKKVGTFGMASAFSLQGQKTLTGGEGGVLLTNNDELFYKALLLGHYNKRCKEEIPKNHPLYPYHITGMGLKFRIHPLAAAIANEQFDNIRSIMRKRRETAKKLIKALGSMQGISVPKIPADVEPGWYAFVMQYKSEELGGLSLEKFYEALHVEGCDELDRPNSTCPLNQLPLFQNPKTFFPKYSFKKNYSPGQFPVAETFHKNSLKLPVWHRPQDDAVVDLYIKAFKKVTENYREVL
jgi:dTDP-4-amino-4,6-dideoxygalactose transaminase